MPTFYDIARKTRNQLPYMQGYGGGIGAGRSTPPTGMGQHMIEADYFAPDFSNEQYWYENADPESRYNSFADAIEATGGDPEMERKVALMNYQAAQEQQAQRQKMAMNLLQEQRMREKNRLQYLNAQASRQAAQARYDQSARRTEADEADRRSKAAIWKAGVADPQNRDTYLKQYKGTPEELNAFSLSMDNAAKGLVEDQERRNTPIFRSALSSINRGDHKSLGRYNLKESDFLPYQVAQMQGEADARDRLADGNSEVAKANIKVMARAEASLYEELKAENTAGKPKISFSDEAEKQWKNKGQWTPNEQWAFQFNPDNYQGITDDFEEKVDDYNKAVKSTFVQGVYQTIAKDKTGEWVNLWEEGRKNSDGTPTMYGQRFRGNVFSPEEGSGSGSGSEVSRVDSRPADLREAQREAYVAAQRQRAIEKQANIEERNFRGEEFRKNQQAFKWGVLPDSPEYNQLVKEKEEEEAAVTREWMAANPYSSAAKRHYRDNPELRGESAIQYPEWDTQASTAPTDFSFDPALISRSGPDPFGSDFISEDVADLPTDPFLRDIYDPETGKAVEVPVQQPDNSGLTEVNIAQWTALLNNKHQALITQWLEVHPNEPINEMSLRHQAVNELRKQGYKLN